MKKTLLAASIMSLCTPLSFSYAAEAVFSTNKANSETMVVTARRMAQPLKNVITPISIVTKNEIEAMQANTIADVLQRLPGVKVISSGGPGQITSVYLRGSASNQILILLNGVRINSATAGGADFSQVPLTAISKIELIRGSRAAQYGSDAIGGVLNIITSIEGQGNSAQVTTGIGSHGYHQLGASAQGINDDGAWIKVATDVNGADGFSAMTEPADQDSDSYSNQNSYIEIGTHLDNHWKISLQGLLHNGESDFDNGYTDFSTGQYVNNPNAKSKARQYSIAGKTEYTNQDYFSELTVAQNQDKLDTGDDNTPVSTIKSDRISVNWFNHYQINGNWGVGGGVEWYRDNVDNSSSSYTKDERDNKAIYGTSSLKIADWLFDGSIRTDDNDSYGRNNTWQAGVAYELTSNLTLSTNVGTAFRAPTFNDLYYPGGGNPNLKPEESTSYELGIRGDYQPINWYFNGFHNKLNNLIAWAPDPTDSTGTNWMPSNVDKATLQGIEIGTEFHTWALFHDISYDYLDSEDKKTGKQLIYRSKHSAKWNVGYTADIWQLDMTAIYYGQSYSDANNTQKVEAYTLVDLGTSYFVTDQLTLRVKVTNLFNKSYVSKANYNSAEREFYLNAAYQF